MHKVAIAVAAALLVSLACGVTLHHSATLGIPKSCVENIALCADGRPVIILQSLACEAGICGYTCEPSRWEGR